MYSLVDIYCGRRSIETTFQECRSCLGLETTRGWCRATVTRPESEGGTREVYTVVGTPNNPHYAGMAYPHPTGFYWSSLLFDLTGSGNISSIPTWYHMIVTEAAP